MAKVYSSLVVHNGINGMLDDLYRGGVPMVNMTLPRLKLQVKCIAVHK
jgi:hypothetical protein